MTFLIFRKINILLLAALLVSAFIVPLTAEGNIERTFTVQPASNFAHQYGIINLQPRLLSGHSQKLYVSIPVSLVDYYGNLTHTINDDSDYAKFVTPQAVAPIADSLLQVTDKSPNSQEQFADAVLAFVHQIPYNVTDPQYPVETLANNMGDCVGLSLLAASIMEAGGLNVVLILYTGINPQHMNVGVYLPYTPVYHNVLEAPTGFTYQNKTYWTAEATPESNWKVGDQSLALAGAQANIIPLNDTLQSFAPGKIAASLNSNLLSSTITLNPSQPSSSTDVNGERTLNMSGSITPAMPDQTVSIYVSSEIDNDQELSFLTATTDNKGDYSLSWNFTQSGTYYVTASWNGASNYAGADSQAVPIFVGPQSYYQFNAIGYNYIFGQPGLAAFATMPMQGVDDFLTLPLGGNVSLSYSFIVLKAGQTISNVPTTNVTVPAEMERVLLSNGKVETVMVPAHNETVPVDVPDGLSPLMLPDDFNQTLDNQFSFILENNSGNYSLVIKGLSQEDLSNMQPDVPVTNATESVQDGTWYQITTDISGGTATSSLRYENGTLITSGSNDGGSNQTVLLVTNNEDTAIALKDLTIQTTTSAGQSPQTTPQKPFSNLGKTNVELYVTVAVLVAAAVAIALFVRLRKTNKKQVARK